MRLVAILFSALMSVLPEAFGYGVRPESLSIEKRFNEESREMFGVLYFYSKLTEGRNRFDNHEACFPDRARSVKELIGKYGFSGF